MTGEIEAAGGGGGGGGGGGITVRAQNISFDTDSIRLPADAPSTITFENADAGVQHNISIYSGPDLAEQLFQGDLVTGPGSAEYPIPPLPAGQYYFQCDVHPNMNGAVVVEPGGGGGGPGPPEPSGPSGAPGASGG
jgi:plastocyanin